MEEDQVVVDIHLTDLSKSMSLELDKLNEKDYFIFPVPYKFRQSKTNLFDPSVVSIGPLHHGKESLKATEDQKWRFLRDFLSRGDHISLDLCLLEIKKLEEKTRRCYSESVPLDSNGFVQMMLLDGCFVLEHFLKWYERRLNSIDDSVFIPSDLLLLENQIPFFIIDKLCEIGLKPDMRRDFTKYLFNVFAKAGPAVPDDSIFPYTPYDSIFPYTPYDSIFQNPTEEIHHFVHLCYHYSTSINPNICSTSFSLSIMTKIKSLLLGVFLWVLTRIFPKRNSQSLSFRKSVIPCADKLQNAGIELRPKSKPYNMLDISFENLVLEIPTLTITNESKILLANLIAFEQYKSDKMSANLSSFALFFDSLINTPEDVMILQQCGIIKNCLDSEEELTDFFNQICEGMVVEKDHYFAELFKVVSSYCELSWIDHLARWNMHKKQFIKDYFSSPWTAISLVAAVVIVLLTCVQSFFAIYAYYVPPS
ncbi:UPF0481 protein At3g47200-like [Carex rostrata]